MFPGSADVPVGTTHNPRRGGCHPPQSTPPQQPQPTNPANKPSQQPQPTTPANNPSQQPQPTTQVFPLITDHSALATSPTFKLKTEN
ncbi:MAG: hypothetical protein ACSHX9_05690 [Luteolibacter sp.]